MATPVLTKKQQKQSLSAKKGPVRGLRNLLAQPHENYWPTINIDQYPALTTLMNELLPLIRQPSFKIPGSMLRHMSREQRLLARREALEKESTKPDNNLLKFVILGINIITRALEKNNVCCILLDANVEPPLLIKHIVVMAQNKKVPVLLLPVLKTITLQTIGFATAALALKRDVMQSSDNVFHALYKLVAEVFKDFEPPKCSLQLFRPDETCESTMHEVKTINANCDTNSNISKPVRSVIAPTDVYRYRSSRKDRTFVPPTVSWKNVQISQAMSNELTVYNNDLDYANDTSFRNISENKKHANICEEEDRCKNTGEDKAKLPLAGSKLMTDNTDLPKHVPFSEDSISGRRKNSVTYLSLKVKCVQGNNNRIKATKAVKKKKK
ncbi:uncharacterized protein LOC105181569 [Harpegnathos saltator]|uniref:uncharacterized protein LOC105181569 n=1 Tax=Harpegnathos saltator TaxID=610380 RepID=UPI000DBEDF1B|nr:uncharacterized protein LOC105181569 [Harpegnathos saltator]XP_011136735.2 uncharacterized protein LOC105181569 [Harpegnathos saltator]